jgi:uncharacterized NAD(P)/FAD-binding protein YdhS
MPDIVAIAGGGASGVLAAAALLERCESVRVVIVDPAERLGRGLAYSTRCAVHQLNVPAGRISAFPDQPDHFVRWLAANVAEPYGPDSFVPRSIYGDYLGAIADDVRARAPGRFRHVVAVATDASVDAGGVRIACSNGETIVASALVVAAGNPAPAAWPGLSDAVRASGRFFDSAWEDGALVPGKPDEPVVILGTGLTAIDVALGLRDNGHRGPIAMISRRGLLPHEHRAHEKQPANIADATTCRELLASLRRNTRDAEPAAGNWRGIIDDLRPRTNDRWQSLSLAEQRRFVRHGLAYWNVHRHRIPPESAKAIAELMASGVLRVIAARVGTFAVADSGLQVSVRARGAIETTTLAAARVVNCSGPELDVRKSTNPLVRSLLAQGRIVPHALGIGVRVAPCGAFIGADGRPAERVFALGPLRFGTLFETTAMPEVRTQARDLAATLEALLGENASATPTPPPFSMRVS